MKQMSSYLAAALCLLASCEKAPSFITQESPAYSGKMTVLYEGEDFVQEGIEVLAEFNEDSTMMDLKLKRVKFVPAMPVSIDVTILEIPVSETGDGEWSFYCDGITPWAMGGPYDTFRVDGLSGTVSDTDIAFSLDFYHTRKQASYPTTYSGTSASPERR